VLIILPNKIIGAAAFTPYGVNRVHMNVIFIDAAWRQKGFGTQILRHAARIYSNKEVTLSVALNELHMLGLYCKHGHAEPTHVNAESGIVILSLRHSRLVHTYRCISCLVYYIYVYKQAQADKAAV
jgi:ribosomal protein S18 acetylase RimI-like enzyme